MTSDPLSLILSSGPVANTNVLKMSGRMVRRRTGNPFSFPLGSGPTVVTSVFGDLMAEWLRLRTGNPLSFILSSGPIANTGILKTDGRMVRCRTGNPFSFSPWVRNPPWTLAFLRRVAERLRRRTSIVQWRVSSGVLCMSKTRTAINSLLKQPTNEGFIQDLGGWLLLVKHYHSTHSRVPQLLPESDRRMGVGGEGGGGVVLRFISHLKECWMHCASWYVWSKRCFIPRSKFYYEFGVSAPFCFCYFNKI